MTDITLPPRPPLPANLPSVASARLPELYAAAKDAMKRAERIDECKDWADKMQAMASYAKQADDSTLLKTAVRIQSRAIKRCGELLRELTPKATPGRPKKHAEQNGVGSGTISRDAAAKEAGLSTRQKHTALRVAAVPDEEFERLVDSDDPPTVTELAARGARPAPKPLVDLQGRDPKEFALSTQVQGQLEDFAKMCAKTDVKAAVRGAFEEERADMARDARAAMKWLERLVKEIES